MDKSFEYAVGYVRGIIASMEPADVETTRFIKTLSYGIDRMEHEHEREISCAYDYANETRESRVLDVSNDASLIPLQDALGFFRGLASCVGGKALGDFDMLESLIAELVQRIKKQEGE